MIDLKALIDEFLNIKRANEELTMRVIELENRVVELEDLVYRDGWGT